MMLPESSLDGWNFRDLDRIIADMAHLAAVGDFMSATEADTRFHATIADVSVIAMPAQT